MKANKILFIGSLPTKKVHFNGETNKTGDIFKILHKYDGIKLRKINLTHFKILGVIKLLFHIIFFKYKTIFISKCVTGGSLVIHLIKKFGNKNNKKNVVFYWIGNGTLGLEGKKIYLDDLKICKWIILESELVLDDNKSLSNINSVILPCLKPNYDLTPITKDYSKIETLKCIYFSRICEQKGLMDAIKAVELANKQLGKTAFKLDIAGAPTTTEAVNFEKKVISYIQNKNDEFTYFGPSFCVTGIDTYKRLQEYDLHIFPSQFKQECVPGSIVDMFIAGVPTVSSSFTNCKNLLTEKDSYIFQQGSVSSLTDCLVRVYKNMSKLNEKRLNSFELRKKYDEDNFIGLMKQIEVI